MDLAFYEDPAAFLAVAGDHLAADPVRTTVIATVTRRAVDGLEPARGSHPRWWVAVRDGGEVVGAAMRTAPMPPYPMYVLPMPEAAALALARGLHARDELVPGINGALPAVQTVATEMARLAGGEARVEERMLLHTIDTLVPPPPVAGRLRPATAEELDLVLRWYAAFDVDAAEQAGRTAPHRPPEPQDEANVLPRIEQGQVWLWEDDRGAVVHVTAHNPPAFGVARVGPVYTPPEHRGHGYARAAVAQVTRRLLDEGLRVCLFTDVDNPTSNRVYESIGYRPVGEQASMVVTTPARV